MVPRVAGSSPVAHPTAAVDELTGRLGMVTELDRGIGPIKHRDRGLTGGQLLMGMAAAQLVGPDCLAGLDRVRGDAGSALLAGAAVPASTTAGRRVGLRRRDRGEAEPGCLAGVGGRPRRRLAGRPWHGRRAGRGLRLPAGRLAGRDLHPDPPGPGPDRAGQRRSAVPAAAAAPSPPTSSRWPSAAPPRTSGRSASSSPTSPPATGTTSVGRRGSVPDQHRGTLPRGQARRRAPPLAVGRSWPEHGLDVGRPPRPAPPT